MKLPHPIPYQGSKRNLANQILAFFPKPLSKLIEPFAGSAAISIASAFHKKADNYLINDINKPLSSLLEMIVNCPDKISDKYQQLWNDQHDDHNIHFLKVRSDFNRDRDPALLLFLLAKCVKAAVRYNAYGEFNQSSDKRRLGKQPDTMKNDIYSVSHLLKGKCTFMAEDYKIVLDRALPDDLVYMDPPYQGTGKNGGFNYAGNIIFEEFVNSLTDLNSRNIPYILSFDGRTGDKTYGIALPDNLKLYPIEINAGRSSQATLLNRKEYTVELLYLSPSLVSKIDLENILTLHTLQENGLFAIYGNQESRLS